MRTIAILLATLLLASTVQAEVGINCRVNTQDTGPIAPGDRQVELTVACDGGLVLTGGGQSCGIAPATHGEAITASTYPDGDPAQWECVWDNQTLLTVNCSCDAICCTMTPVEAQAPVVCEHDECLQGNPLDQGCSECVDTVCACDAYCCDTKWDSYCVHEAQQLCDKTCNSTAICLDACGCP